MDISVVVPNFNGEKLLEKNVPKLAEVLEEYILRTKKEIEIVVTDDSSEDNSVSVVKSLIERYSGKNLLSLELVENRKNLGFSGNVNRGVEKAKGEILVLLNTDVIPKKGFLDRILKHFENPKLFAAACMDESVEGDKVVLRGRGIGSWKRGFLIHSRGSIDKDNTLWVSGGSGLFRKSIWQKIGGLNEIYNPFYWEDIDLSYRALKSGYQTVFEKDSVVIHEHEKGAIKSKFTPFDVKVIAYRNQFIFVWTNLTDKNLLILHVLWFPYHILKAILNKDLAFFLGFFKAFNLAGKIVESRSANIKSFIKGDSQVTAPYIE